jgi:transcription initiation factor TFIIIB Brf1 subunit/transcription initiation factor TFIIB
MLKCPECNGVLACNKFEVTCRRCGLVVKEPFCVQGVLVFEWENKLYSVK